MIDILICEELMEVMYIAQNRNEVINMLSSKMTDLECVRCGFVQAVLAREREYPTGLPTKIPVALCHVEAEYVNRSALAVATLSKPVEFHNMGNPKSVLSVEIVFLLTIVNPKNQVFYLRKMCEMFKSETLSRIKLANSKKDIVNYLYKYFFDR